ncbi:MAG: hypothetical protein V7752_03795 [Halopseudomonas sp.]
MLCLRMPVPLLLITLLIIVLLTASSSAIAANESSDSAQHQLQSLPGFWKGEAVETPVGPMNYDMVFHRCREGTIAGVAKTGASLHYWQFKPDEIPVQLRFLSTFRGNRTPVQLLSKRSEGAVLEFYAPELELLTLGITFSTTNVDIRIYHYGNPHVHIRLARTDNRPAELAQHHSLPNSCRGYPLGSG